MSLSHEEFFALAIDRDRPPHPELVEAIDDHRAECPSCAELERDYVTLREVAKSMPMDLSPEPPDMEEGVMAAVRARPIVRKTRPRPALLRALAFAAVAVVSLGVGIGLDRSRPERLPSKEALCSMDVEVALYLERNGYHDQAKLLAQHALTEGRLAPREKADAEAIVRR